MSEKVKEGEERGRWSKKMEARKEEEKSIGGGSGVEERSVNGDTEFDQIVAVVGGGGRESCCCERS